MLHIEYQLSEDDFVAAAKLVLRKRKRPLFSLFFIPIIGACMVLFSLLLLTTGSPVWGAFNLLYGLFMLSYPLLRARSVRKQFRKRPATGKPVCLEIDDTEVHFTSPYMDSRASWTLYEAFTEDASSFVLLQQGRLHFVSIPKRQLAPEQLEALRVIVSTHVVSA